MFTKETLKKYFDKAMKVKAELMDRKDLKVCISTGNKKIGKVWNVSLAPILSCGNCAECKYHCYDVKACVQYTNVLYARMRNFVLATVYPEQYWKQIRERLSHKRTYKYFRFHVGGEIMTEKYFDEMVKTARMFPDFRMWTYTKQYNLVNEYVRKHGNDRKIAIPENLVVMFSEWKGMPMDNPYKFPVFRCVFRGKESPRKGEWKCTGDCGKCIALNRGCVKGENSWVWDH